MAGLLQETHMPRLIYNESQSLRQLIFKSLFIRKRISFCTPAKIASVRK